MTATPPRYDLSEDLPLAAKPDAAGGEPDRQHAGWLSSLADGEAGAETADSACSAWRDDPESRATWHAYQLIGDALRSDELVTPPGHDAAFLARLRVRLAAEPVPLTPSAPIIPIPVAATTLHAANAASAMTRRRQAWLGSAAIAAGFMAVAGVLVVTLSVPAGDEGPWFGFSRDTSGGRTPSMVVVPANATMLRNAGLDRYLEAHRGLPGQAPGVAVGAGLRSVDAVAPMNSPAIAGRASAASAGR